MRPRHSTARRIDRSERRARRPCTTRARSLIAGVLFAAILADPATGIPGQSPGSAAAIDGPPPPVPPEVVSRDELGRVTLRAVRVDPPIAVDGLLEEEVYLRVPAVSDFIQQEPHEGRPATEKTEAWVLFDRDHIYIAARCWDSHPERMVANELRRDHSNIFQNENFTVVLDTFYDRRNGFFFQTNPLGALRDQAVSDEGTQNDTDWNTVWDVKTSRFSRGWTLEMALPFKSLRYSPGTPQIWGINLRRVVRWKNEQSFLSPVPASFSFRGIYKFSSAATLVGLEPPEQSRNLELKPYALSSLTTDLEASPPYRNEPDFEGGLDLKYGLTTGLIADFTFNTDFAQVEEDQQQVNLTRFSLFFPEKRDFFLEGQGIFGFGGVQSRRGNFFRPGEEGGELTPIVFFSRQIGLSGGRVVPIVAGGRLTGRAGKFRIGALNIQTGGQDKLGGMDTNFSVLRLRRDILRRSDVGIIATYRDKSLSLPEGSNAVLGVDANFAFFQDWKINAYYARSRTAAAAGSADEPESYLARFDYAADRYGLLLEHLFVGRDFNPELGFLRREDFRRSRATARFSPRPRSIPAIRKFTWEAELDYIADPGGRLETRRLQGTFKTEFENSDELTVELTENFEYLPQSFEVAPGVILPVGGYSFRDLRAIYQLGPQRPVSGFATLRHGGFFSGERTEASFNGRVEVTPQFSLEPGLAVNWVELPQGSFITRLASLRLSYALSSRMALANFLQYNSTNKLLSSSLRFRWEYSPGSDLYVVYSEGRDTAISGFARLANRTFVVKFTRLFRF